MTNARDELMALARACPELNMRNYKESDVEELNNWAVEVALAIEAAQPAVCAQQAQQPSGEPVVPLANHDEIGRKVINLPWNIQKAVVTIAAHCKALTDEYPAGAAADLAGCISQNCNELADALAATPQQEMQQVIDWVDSWVSNPVAAYSVYALDGLFALTRQKIAALATRAPPQINETSRDWDVCRAVDLYREPRNEGDGRTLADFLADKGIAFQSTTSPRPQPEAGREEIAEVLAMEMWGQPLKRLASNVADGCRATADAIRALATKPAQGDPACITAVVTNEPCEPYTDDYKRCRICGFVVDTSFKAEKPSIDFTMQGRTKNKPAQGDVSKTGPCEHKSIHDGPRVKAVYGTAPTQVCDCGMWRTNLHVPGPWQAPSFPSTEGK